MSPSILVIIVNVAATLLPFIGVNLGSDQLTTAAQVIIAVVTGAILWARHLALKKQAFGGAKTRVTLFGNVKIRR